MAPLDPAASGPPDPPGSPGGDGGSQPSAATSGLRLRLHGWLHPAVLAAAALSLASGFAQFGVVTALGDVARAFGQGAGAGVAEQLGLSGAALGGGLALVRAAALAGLPLAAYADRRGRKTVLIACAAAGLALTAAAAGASGYWMFIALFALGRPLLSATNAICGVVAAEETPSADRAKAVALITAAYGTGAGLTAIVRAIGGGAFGFRGLFALNLLWLALLPLLARLLEEPERFSRLGAPAARRVRLGLGAVHRSLWGRLATISGLTFAVGFATTPINSFVFAYSESVLGLVAADTALIIVAAAPLGLAGLVTGRWAADNLGRRPTCLVMHAALGLTGVLVYTGPAPLAIAGYLLGLLAGSAYAPAIGAMSAEVFPTVERATAAGWLTAAAAAGAVSGLFCFGLLADRFDSFAVAAVVVCLPAVASAGGYLLLPETRGLELEEAAPDVEA